MSNGCGMFGTISNIWKKISGKYPPFEDCCDEHDLAYEQIENEADRQWADNQFKRCMEKRGYRILGWIFNFFIRTFGWLSPIKEKIKKAFITIYER